MILPVSCPSPLARGGRGLAGALPVPAAHGHGGLLVFAGEQPGRPRPAAAAFCGGGDTEAAGAAAGPSHD